MRSALCVYSLMGCDFRAHFRRCASLPTARLGMSSSPWGKSHGCSSDCSGVARSTPHCSKSRIPEKMPPATASELCRKTPTGCRLSELSASSAVSVPTTPAVSYAACLSSIATSRTLATSDGLLASSTESSTTQRARAATWSAHEASHPAMSATVGRGTSLRPPSMFRSAT